MAPRAVAFSPIGCDARADRPRETGAATVALPQDVQAEAFDWPESLFAQRTWHVARPLPELGDSQSRGGDPAAPQRLADRRRWRRIHSGASDNSAACWPRRPAFRCRDAGGQGSLPYDHPQSVGAIGSTGTTAANALAAEADVVIGIGTRYSDFTSASRTAFNDPAVRFVNINVTSFDSVKQGGLSVVADARSDRGADHRPRRLLGQRRILARAQLNSLRSGMRRYGGIPRRGRRQHAESEPGDWSANRRRIRATWWCARPARCRVTCTTVAHPRPQGLSRRIRLLLHGIRGGRRHRHQNGQPRPRRVRHRVGRRLILDDGDRTSSPRFKRA